MIETSKLSAPTLPSLVIAPSTGWGRLDLGELWRYRDLLYLLVWRDFSSRYRQSLIGVGWAVARPVLSMLVFTLVFGRMAKLPSEGVPYPVFTFAALLPWMLFSSCLTGASASLVNNRTLLTKVYFPRLLLPLASMATGLIDFAIQLVLFALLLGWYRLPPTLNAVFLPFFLLLALVVSLAVGVWTAVLNVRYRDVQQAVPFLTQIWLWLTPVAYSASLVPEQLRLLYGLNPMVGVVEGFRWALLGRAAPDWGLIALATVGGLFLLVFGASYLKRSEASLADLI